MRNKKLKIAIVYDWIDKWGGVERVLLHLHSLFPDADFFTSSVNLKKAQWAQSLSIQSTFLQRLPTWITSHRIFLTPFFPLAFESLRFDRYDLVISITSAFAKGVITKPGTSHICYLLTPPRYLWSHASAYISRFISCIGKPIINHLKRWDVYSSTRPDAIISISQSVADRAKKIYKIDSPVIFPPFDTNYWDKQIRDMSKPSTIANKQYFLWVGRMESYKKPELIVEVARKYPHYSFIMVGIGSLAKKLHTSAPNNCHFTGFISDFELAYLYTNAQALIMPQNEDFGYVSLESQYCGCPVIAYRDGGARETIQEGVSGLFFNEQSASSIGTQLERYEEISYNLKHSTIERREAIKSEFGMKRFNAQFSNLLQTYISL